MFYGDHKKTPMVSGTKPKNGSSYAFQFLIIAVLVDGERHVLGVLPINSKGSDLICHPEIQLSSCMLNLVCS